MKILLSFAVFLVLIMNSISPTAVFAQENEPLQVVASFSILADVVQNVAGDAAVVTSLVPVNADPHSFQPAVRDAARLAEADMVFISGVGFEQNLLEIIENAGEDVNIVIASQCVKILPYGEPGPVDYSFESDTAVHCDGHYTELQTLAPAQEETATYLGALYELPCDVPSEDHGDEGGCDPHVWQDPHNVMLWTLFIRDTLSTLDPENAALYRANAEAYLQKLIALDTELHEMVSAVPEENRQIVTNHDTTSYLAQAYGFEIAATVIPTASTLAEPSARDLARLIDQIRENDIRAIFAENTVNPELAEQVASETDAKFYTLYTDSLSEADQPASTYLDYMRYNITTIVGALSE